MDINITNKDYTQKWNKEPEKSIMKHQIFFFGCFRKINKEINLRSANKIKLEIIKFVLSSTEEENKK
jgi:hypothetical protein